MRLDQNARFALHGTSFNNFKTYQHTIAGLNLVQPDVSVGMSKHCLKLFSSPPKAEVVFTVHIPAGINKQNAFILQNR